MISLGFYRILEVELNQKVIIPLLSGIAFTDLYNEFIICENTFSGDDKKDIRVSGEQLLRLIRKW